MAMTFLTNIYLWMGGTFLFLILFILLMILLIILGKKTHAILEFKAWMKGRPIALFFQDNRYCEWKPVKPEAGIVQDKDYGSFIINERATYVDKRTKNILIPFDAAFGASVNIKAAKLADDLQCIIRDNEQMNQFKIAVANNTVAEHESINAIKTSVEIGAIKNMMTALIPHNINAKIEKVIASRMKQYGGVNGMQAAIVFGMVFGGIIAGYLVVKLLSKTGTI